MVGVVRDSVREEEEAGVAGGGGELGLGKRSHSIKNAVTYGNKKICISDMDG